MQEPSIWKDSRSNAKPWKEMANSEHVTSTKGDFTVVVNYSGIFLSLSSVKTAPFCLIKYFLKQEPEPVSCIPGECLNPEIPKVWSMQPWGEHISWVGAQANNGHWLLPGPQNWWQSGIGIRDHPSTAGTPSTADSCWCPSVVEGATMVAAEVGGGVWECTLCCGETNPQRLWYTLS